MTGLRRVHVRVEGTVQGVGFRPFVYRLAHEEALAGHVFNDERGVEIEIEGTPEAVERLLIRLRAEAPPLATIDRVVPRALAPTGGRRFEIRHSAHGGRPDAQIAPDTATCDDCLGELFDPSDRRHRYPFVNCTNCGPRLTIVRGIPYDRPLTTMAAFAMCEDCEREYADPLDRRFHAQPNACPVCGPRARLTDATGGEVSVPRARDAVDGAAHRMADGLVVAVKGLGGYHLACNAADAEAVATLRARKHREDKPFALMVADADAAARIVELDELGRALLTSAARPIVLSPRRRGTAIAPGVAAKTDELGVMLAYTPLHHLLLADAGAALGAPATLVMTSANVSDEPIVYRDQEATERLSGIADLFLVHDRPIETRVDDSIVRVANLLPRRAQTLRRARGYVPAPLLLPARAERPLLAVGAELKSTFCLARGERAWVGHHIGDLEHYPAYESFCAGIAHFEALLEVHPEIVVHDLHPDYRSTRYALDRDGVDVVGVQHHHAHLAACLAEHRRDPGERAVGVIFDGTGYGTDGTIWGGEILVGSLRGFERVAALRAVRMPGGAAAIREPWRMACAWLHDAVGSQTAVPPLLAASVSQDRWDAVAAVGRDRSLSPPTTSIGRLFDAVAALCGIAPIVTYEGQAAIELCGAMRDVPGPGYELAVCAGGAGEPRWVLDPRELVRAVVADLAAGTDVVAVSARFHAAIAASTTQVCVLAARDAGVGAVVLSGGVFQNRRLLEAAAARLIAEGLEVLTPELLPCNDGGISFGQAAIAAVGGR